MRPKPTPTLDSVEKLDSVKEDSAGMKTGNGKEERKNRKRQQLLVEYNLSKSNDETKRPGELLDSPHVKKLKVDPTQPTTLNEEDFKAMKLQLKERKKLLTQLPRFYLQNAGLMASLSASYNDRVPILMSDVQQLLMYSLCGNAVVGPPERWCGLQKYNRLTHIVAMVIEGISSQEYYSYEHLLPKLTKGFPDRVEVLAPSHYGSEVARELACVPLTVNQKDRILEKYGTVEAALNSKEIFKVFHSLFPIRIDGTDATVDEDGNMFKLPAQDMFPRTYLLLNLPQLIMENFPLPFKSNVSTKFLNFKMTKSEYKEVTPYSPILAIDCEMCITTERHELTRIAIVNENHDVIYETLVKPKNRIVNYLTPYSGITEELLKDVTTTLEDVQSRVQQLIPSDAILVGHSLNCDLQAMEMIHPYIIDTSVIFNTYRVNRKQKLATLVEQFLQEEIQKGHDGHSPIEDATATMKLVQLKLSRGYRFGDAVTAEDPNPMIPECQLTSSIFNKASTAKKTVTVIAPESTIEVYKSFSFGGESKQMEFTTVPKKGHKETISRLQSAFVNYNFALAHLDVSKKLKKSSSETDSSKMDRFMTKIDNWCDKVLSGISLNGMCIVLFAGPNDSIDNTIDSAPETSNPHNPDSSILKDDSSDNSQLKSKFVKPSARRNGVCFVRINRQNF